MFPFQSFCRVAGRGAQKGGTLSPAPQNLMLLWVDWGSFSLAGESIPEKSLLLSGAPLRMQAEGSASLLWAELAGQVPAAIAAGLEGVCLLPPEQSAALEPLVANLTDAPRPPAEESAAVYTLLCRITAAREAPPHPLVDMARAEMRENYSLVYGIAELAEHLGVSEAHLIRVFSQHTGKTPGRYLTEVRLENAKRLLPHPDLTLDMVAGMCGFSDANYLAKVFRRHTGESPSTYRRRMQTAGAGALPVEDEIYL